MFLKLISKRLSLLACAGVFVALCCAFDVSAQTRRRSRRAVQPITPQTAPDPNDPDPQVVSTADDANGNANGARRSAAKSSAVNENDPQQMRRTIESLTNQVNKLSAQVTQMRQEQSAIFNMDLLSRAEQRAEAFHAQLRDLQDKEAQLQARADQLEYELQPENVQAKANLIGSLQPDKVREGITRQLEGERARVLKQISLLEADRPRLEAAAVNADQTVERLRAKLNETLNQNSNAQSNANAEGAATTNNNGASGSATRNGSNAAPPPEQ